MPDIYSEHKTVALINHINAAITNIRLYPPTSALIKNSVERLNTAFEEIFSEVPAIVYAESGKNLLIQGQAPAEKVQSRPQLQAFLKMLLEMEIKSLSFERGLTRSEITEFLQLMGSPASEEEVSGGLQKRLEKQNITHIRIDEKIYVERDAGQGIVAEMTISDADIARAALGAQSVSAAEMNQIRGMANNAQWLSRVFQAGLRQIIDSGRGQTADMLKAKLSTMLDSLETLSGSDRSEILKGIARSMTEMEDAEVFAALVRNVDAVFGPERFQEMACAMAEESFRKLYQRLVQMIQDDPANVDPSLRQALELMGKAGKARSRQRFTAPSEAFPAETREPPGKAGENPAEVVDTPRESLQRTFNQLLKGDLEMLPRVVTMAGMSRAIESLAKKGRAKTIAAIGDRLLEGIKSRNASVRESAAEVMAVLDQRLAENDRTEERVELSKKLVEWVRQETEMSGAFETVSRCLRETAESLILADRARDAAPILEAYQMPGNGNLTKDEAIQAVSANLLQNLATDEVLDFLLKDKASKGQSTSEENIYNFVIFGTTTIERLLDRLHDSQNRSERNRVIQLITRIGDPAVKPVLERLAQDGPWYYSRNLVLLLGRIGKEPHLATLERFLGHSDFRVQREAVLAIQNIGGPQAGERLLNRLDDAADEVKAVIISVLGMMNYQKALPYLIMKLENRDLGTNREARSEINAKICEALARMGDARAVPLLEKIARSRKYLGIRAYDPRVKTAAESALAGFESSSP